MNSLLLNVHLNFKTIKSEQTAEKVMCSLAKIIKRSNAPTIKKCFNVSWKCIACLRSANIN